MVWAYRFHTGLFRLIEAYCATSKATQAVQFFKCFYHITRWTLRFKICLYPAIIVTNKKWSKVHKPYFHYVITLEMNTKNSAVHV